MVACQTNTMKKVTKPVGFKPGQVVTLQSSSTGPALHDEGGSRPKSCNSWKFSFFANKIAQICTLLIRFNAIGCLGVERGWECAAHPKVENAHTRGIVADTLKAYTAYSGRGIKFEISPFTRRSLSGNLFYWFFAYYLSVGELSIASAWIHSWRQKSGGELFGTP